jgi:hypothetical protein
MSQNAQIAAHLKRGHKLTALDALEQFGCLRLAARISDLKAKGLPIESRYILVGSRRKKVAQYYWSRTWAAGNRR